MKTNHKKTKETEWGFAEIARRIILTGLLLFVIATVGGCGQSEDGPEPTTAINTNEMSITVTPVITESTVVPTVTPTSQPENKILVMPMNEEIRADLNQDGVTERISVVPVGDVDWLDGHSEAVNIIINDTTYDSSYLQDTCGVYTDYVDTTNFYLLDIDTKDSYLDIAFFDEGPSNDPVTRVFRYQNETLNYIGCFTDQPGTSLTGNVRIPGDGTIYATTRLDLLQTWWAEGLWQLKDGKLEEVQREYYYPYVFDDSPAITLVQDVKAYQEPDKNAGTVAFMKGEEIVFTRIYQYQWPNDKDDTFFAWVELQNAEGVTGWFYCNQEHYINFEDKQLDDATEFFENLNMVD